MVGLSMTNLSIFHLTSWCRLRMNKDFYSHLPFVLSDIIFIGPQSLCFGYIPNLNHFFI